MGHLLVDWVADYRARMAHLPVMSPVKPGEIKRQLPVSPPRQGERLDAVIADLEHLLLPGITHWNHPRFFAYFPSNTSLPSVLADLLASGLGPQCMSWQTSPAATELEEVVMDWLRQMVGLPESFTGVIQDTASTSTLVALLCARERVSDFSQNRGGLQAENAPFIVYASDQAHASVDKAALLAGFGAENLRKVASDAQNALSPAALEAAILEDVQAGRRPCAVVATVGSTATTAVDPLWEVARLASQHGLWLHVDAAMAGSAMILPECRPHWAGIEQADSLVFNPHKWMGAGFDLSAYYARDPQHLVRVMSTNPSYLRTAQDTEVKNLRDFGIPLGRRFRALKLWMVIRDQGIEGLQQRLRRDLENARWFAAQVEATPGWERLAKVPFQTVCLRHVPPGLRGEALDAHNLALAQAVNASGKAYVTAAVVKGVQLLRVSVGAEPTERGDLEALWTLFQETAQGLAAGSPGTPPLPSIPPRPRSA